MKTLAKKQSHIDQIRTMNLTQIENVCQLLGWSHEDYTKHQYIEYEMFIAKACTDAPEFMNDLRHSKEFCGFYINEWIRRNNTSFLPFAVNQTTDVYDLLYEFDISNGQSKRFEYGVRCFEGLEYGDPLLIEEYLIVHSYETLFCDADFQHRYENIIDKLLCHA
jgi:hypothetical protein